MKKQIIRGEGVQGMCLTISVCDMYAANQVADELLEVIENHKTIEEYDKCAYDKRKELFPGGRPQRIEVVDETLNKLHLLLCKMSLSTQSTLFKDEDEDEEQIKAAIGTRENPRMFEDTTFG